MREITDYQIDLAVGHLVRRKAGHLLAGPTADRFRIADQRTQAVPCQVLGRVHRLIEIGADGACAGAVEGVARQALRQEQRQTGAIRMRGGSTPSAGQRAAGDG
jgi:hypothetical protein